MYFVIVIEFASQDVRLSHCEGDRTTTHIRGNMRRERY